MFQLFFTVKTVTYSIFQNALYRLEMNNLHRISSKNAWTGMSFLCISRLVKISPLAT